MRTRTLPNLASVLVLVGFMTPVATLVGQASAQEATASPSA
jgi:hypothetical protein